VSNDQQPGWPQQPFGEPGQQHGHTPMPRQTPTKRSVPVWGWIAGGAGVVAVAAIAGVMVFNGLSGGSKDPEALPDPGASDMTALEKLTAPRATELAETDVYLDSETDFTSAPVWSVKEPQGWSTEPVKEGMVTYKNSKLQCTFTVFQGHLPDMGDIGDKAATAAAMASEVEAFKKSVGKPVEFVEDSFAYVGFRDGSQDIQMQVVVLRYKNDKDVDVVYRMAVRATNSSSGLMELAMSCPSDLPTEYGVWQELTDRVTMVDAT
jgi:hypothetical protein